MCPSILSVSFHPISVSFHPISVSFHPICVLPSYCCVLPSYLCVLPSYLCVLPSYLCALPSTHPQRTTLLPLDGFSLNMIFEYFFWKYIEKIQVSLMSGKNNMCLTKRLKHNFDNILLNLQPTQLFNRSHVCLSRNLSGLSVAAVILLTLVTN